VPVTPTRIFDSRPATRLNYLGQDKPRPGSMTEVQVTGRGPVPAEYTTTPPTPLNATAVVVNITATEATAPGFVQVAPTGMLVPGASSSLNVEHAGQTIANQVIVPVIDILIVRFGEVFPGGIQIYTQGGADFVVDVLGYFTGPAATASTQGLFVPVQPIRMLDTRPCCLTGYDGPKPPRGSMFLVETAHRGGVTAVGVAAVATNITITEASGPGFVQAGAAGTLVPGASSILNATSAGQTIPNAALIPTNDIGRFALFTQSGGHLIADVSGYFTT